MARLYVRGRVFWCWGYDVHGTRWRASTHQREREAAKVAARIIERERADPARHPAAKATLRKTLDALIGARERAGRADATIEFLVCKGSHVARVLGPDRDISTITLADCEGYVTARREDGAALATVAKELGTLRSALRLAARHGGYSGDTRAIMPDGIRDVSRPRERWLPIAEYRALLSQLTPDRRAYVIAWCHLGVRESELYSLAPGDVDLEGDRVHVRGTKTRRSRRWVPLDFDARAVLKARVDAERPVLFAPWGKVQRDLARACKRAGIAPVTPNDLRRTFTSWMAQAGVPMLVCARLLGHSSTAMVERTYAQIDLTSERNAVAMLPRSLAVTGGVTDARARNGRIGRNGRRTSRKS